MLFSEISLEKHPGYCYFNNVTIFYITHHNEAFYENGFFRRQF